MINNENLILIRWKYTWKLEVLKQDTVICRISYSRTFYSVFFFFRTVDNWSTIHGALWGESEKVSPTIFAVELTVKMATPPFWPPPHSAPWTMDRFFKSWKKHFFYQCVIFYLIQFLICSIFFIYTIGLFF